MCEQRCRGDERPRRADDVNMVCISHKSQPVSSDEANMLKIPMSDPDRIQALDYIPSTDYKNAIYRYEKLCLRSGERGHGLDT
jgi:hypothetical protein